MTLYLISSRNRDVVSFWQALDYWPFPEKLTSKDPPAFGALDHHRTSLCARHTQAREV